jgi:DNA-binding NarL/FixJ family response regulator
MWLPGGADQLKIFLADPQVVFRDALRALFEKEPDWVVSGEAGDGMLCLEMARRLRPDVVVLDARLPRMSGIDVVRGLQEAGAEIPCLILTAEDRCRLVQLGLEAGARGWVTKQSSSHELLKGIGVVADGGTYLSLDIVPCVVSALTGEAETSSLTALSNRERQSLQLLAEGLSSKEIAEVMMVSVRTVESYRARLMEKLGLHKASQLVRYAIREGLVEP